MRYIIETTKIVASTRVLLITENGAPYCLSMAKSGINPKTLHYLMGHSDISVTMNVYTHIGFDDAEEELKRMEEFRKAQAEVEQNKEKTMLQKMFEVI